MLHKSEVRIGDTLTHVNDGIVFVVARIDDRRFYDAEDNLKAAFSRDASAFWRITARASASASAPSEGEQVGAVWVWTKGCRGDAVVVTGKDQCATFSQTGNRTALGSFVEAQIFIEDRTYAGNLSAVFAGLVRLHEVPLTVCGMRVKVDPTMRRGEMQYRSEPLVDAEELAAKQRAAHKAESEALTKRYKETFLPAVAEAVKGTRVRAVSDCVHGHSSGKPFMVELSVDGVRKTLFFAVESSKWTVMTDINQAMLGFAGELGSRLLKGGGK